MIVPRALSAGHAWLTKRVERSKNGHREVGITSKSPRLAGFPLLMLSDSCELRRDIGAIREETLEVERI
jgi:hypothetical protein